MATPDPSEILTVAEVQAISDALANPHFVNGLAKIFGFDKKYHQETMEQAALADQVNANRIIHAAARARASAEIFKTIKGRMEILTPRGHE